MIIVGMDPSLSNWGIVRTEISKDREIQLLEATVIHTTNLKRKLPKNKIKIPDKLRAEVKANNEIYKNVEMLNRGRHLCREAFAFIKQADFIFVELPVAGQSAVSCVNYGMCVGLFSAIAEIGIPYEVIRNNEIKKMAGYGEKKIRAVEKDEIVDYIHNLGFSELFSKFKNAEHEHLADALMAVLVGVEKYGDEIITNFYDSRK